MSSPCVKSPQLPIGIRCDIPKPSFDPNNPNCIIISTDYEEYATTPGIYKYNIITNESPIIYKYDYTCKRTGT